MFDPSRLPRPEDLGPDPEIPDTTRMDYLMSRGRTPVDRPRRRVPGRRLRVIVAGGGPAALEAALALRELGGTVVEIHLLAPDPEFRFRPLHVTEPFANGHAYAYPYSALADKGVTHHQDGLAAVDPHKRTVRTSSGATLDYDALLVAAGGRTARAVPGALTFANAASVELMHGLVQDLEGGWCERIAFVAPPGATWTLPAYELALQTAQHADDLCLDRVRITLFTHETSPLEAFGPAGGELATRLLSEAGIDLVTGIGPGRPEGRFDRIVALPVVHGRPIPGLPLDADDFLPVDAAGRVSGVPGVYAAGDGCDADMLKQGGLATQQADAAVRALLADCDLIADRAAERPTLRAILLTGSAAHYLRVGPDGESEASEQPLWWPPSKIAGKRLAPFLDSLDGPLDHERVEQRLARNRPPFRRRAIIAGRGQTRLIPKEPTQ